MKLNDAAAFRFTASRALREGDTTGLSGKVSDSRAPVGHKSLTLSVCHVRAAPPLEVHTASEVGGELGVELGVMVAESPVDADVAVVVGALPLLV